MSTNNNNENKRRRTSNASARADPAPSSAVLPVTIADADGETGGPELLVPKLGEIPKLLFEGMQANDENTVAAAMTTLDDLLNGESTPNAEKNRLEARQIGGVAIVVAAMRKWQRNAVIQRAGCGCIANFSYDEYNEIECSIVTIGGIEAVANALRLFPGDSVTQKNGVLAFGNTFFVPEAVTLGGDHFVYDIDGIQMVLKAMKKFPNDDMMNLGGCCLFANLAAEERFRNAMTNAGVVVAVAGILKNTNHAPTKRCATLFMKQMYGA